MGQCTVCREWFGCGELFNRNWYFRIVPNIPKPHDQGMPGEGFLGELGDFWGTTLADLINNGTVSEDLVRDKVVRLLTGYYYLGQDINPLPPFVYVSAHLATSNHRFHRTQYCVW